MLLPLKDLVLVQDVLEDELIDSVLEAGGDVFDEENQLLLVVLSLLRVLEEAYNL